MKLVQAKQGMLGNLGDALSEAMAAERVKVNDEAGDYRLPQAAKTHAQAVMALILLMRSAEAEHPSSAAFYKGVAREAAYKFRNSGIGNILKTGVDLTKDIARTGQIARDVYTASVGATLPPRKAPRKSGRRSTDTPEVLDTTDLTAPTSWRDRIPTWAPWVAGGTLLALTAVIALRRRGA